MFKEGQPNQESEQMRERVDALRESDNKYEDSAHLLAENEDIVRRKLEDAGLERKYIDELADIFSTKDLEKMEAEEERWTDSLTGLRNKNAYTEEVPQLLGIEKRLNNDCSLLVVDFDHFKRVNDEYGHDAGDEVLKKIAGLLKKNIRSSDVIYRFGGEEFVIFLPSTVSANAVWVAEKIRAEVERAEIVVANAKGKEVKLKKTVSIGCAGTDQLEDWGKYKGDDADKFVKEMFDTADMSVDNSKKQGRNRVTVYSDKLFDEK